MHLNHDPPIFHIVHLAPKSKYTRPSFPKPPPQPPAINQPKARTVSFPDVREVGKAAIVWERIQNRCGTKTGAWIKTGGDSEKYP